MKLNCTCDNCGHLIDGRGYFCDGDALCESCAEELAMESYDGRAVVSFGVDALVLYDNYMERLYTFDADECEVCGFDTPDGIPTAQALAEFVTVEEFENMRAAGVVEFVEVVDGLAVLRFAGDDDNDAFDVFAVPCGDILERIK